MVQTRRTVLLLDRDPTSRSSLRLALEKAGYTVWDAANGLRLVSRLDVDRPDVVVMDTGQAWTDCFDLCRSLKSSGRFKGVRVVLLTDEGEPAERARLACCDRQVPRDPDASGLLEVIRDLFDIPPSA